MNGSVSWTGLALLLSQWAAVTFVLWFYDFSDGPLWWIALVAALSIAVTEVLFALIRVVRGHSWRPQ